MLEDRVSAFRRFEILKDLPDQVFDDLVKSCAWQVVPAGKQVFHANQTSSEVYFVTAGRVRVLLYSLAEGRQVVFTNLGPHQMFGEIAAVDGRPRSATVEALDDCTLAILSKDQFRRLTLEHPAFGFAVMKQLVAHVRRLTDRVHELSVLSVESRVHSELLRLAGLAGETNNQALLSPAPRRSELAARIATTREAVSRVITRLEEEGIVRREGPGLRIVDVERLRKLVHKAKGE